MEHVSTHDLGNGWFANHRRDGKGNEEITLRNAEKGQRIDLPDGSVKTLREIFQAQR